MRTRWGRLIARTRTVARPVAVRPTSRGPPSESGVASGAGVDGRGGQSGHCGINAREIGNCMEIAEDAIVIPHNLIDLDPIPLIR